jgi:hypothetical protein
VAPKVADEAPHPRDFRSAGQIRSALSPRGRPPTSNFSPSTSTIFQHLPPPPPKPKALPSPNHARSQTAISALPSVTPHRDNNQDRETSSDSLHHPQTAPESPPALDPSISNISIATRSPPKSSLGRHDGTHTTESPTRFLSRHASVGQAASITKSRPLPAWNSVTVVVVGCKRTIASRPRCLRLAPPANPTTTDFERLPLAAGHLSLPAPRFRHEPPTRPIPYPPRPPRIQHQPLFFSITSKTLSHF